MKAYRFLTGPDDSSFCRRVTDLLNNGWELAGPGSLTFDPVQGRVICGQPLVKEIADRDYDPEMPLENL
jgi:hypothetical protein